MRYLLQLLLSFLLTPAFYSTTTGQTRNYQIGDTVQNMPLRGKNGAMAENLDLAYFKGQYILLDFWNTYCLSCVEALPKLQALQDKYKDKLQIIMVTDQDSKSIELFLEKRRQLTGVKIALTTVCNDTLYNQSFLHESVPHYVWLNQARRLEYITQSDAVNDSNIAAAISHRPLELNTKQDVYTAVDSGSPLFIDNNGGKGDVIYFSIVSKYVKGIPSISGIYDNKWGRSCAIGFSQTIKELFQIAYNDFLNFWHVPNNRTILEVKDTTPYVFYFNNAYHHENFYNYQLITPKKSYHEMQSLMQADLQRYFKLHATMEKRRVECWVLTCSDTLLAHSKGGLLIDKWDLSAFRLVMQNMPVTGLQRRFIYNILDGSDCPFIDETFIKGSVDIQLDDINKDDIRTVQKGLKKYGMKLSREKRTVDMLVLRE